MLISLKTKICPECGCEEVVSESTKTNANSKQVLAQCDGTRWETRIFACGLIVEYGSIFDKDFIKAGTCRENADALKKIENKKATIKAIKDFTNSLNGDAEVSARVLEALL